MESPTGRRMERADTEASARLSAEGPRHTRHGVSGHTFRATAVAWLLAACALAGAAIGCAPSPESAAAGFDVMEKSIAELNLALEAETVTSQELVEQYLARIEAYDLRGPALNAIVTLNPRVGEDAAALDAERASGTVRSPLHGIPVLLKDNYDTHDMPTTAGVVALAASIPPDDAFQVRRLREAGAVILGKTNMHELARGITTVGSLTGQTRNPYDPTRNPGGSSGGTGAAVAASFAAVGMGSDTCGSIRIPSAHHALVGLRGTRGLASGDGIIPLSRTQDIGGPLARSVEDLALVLDATVGPDPSDPVTELSEGRIPETYTAYLDGNALDGARIGVVLALMGESDAEQPVREVIEAAIETMRGLGAEFLDIEEPDLTEVVADASVIGQEFKFDLDAYLAGTPGAPVRSLEELVATGAYHEIVDGGLRNSLGVESLDTEEYRDPPRAQGRGRGDDHGSDGGRTVSMHSSIRRSARRPAPSAIRNLAVRARSAPSRGCRRFRSRPATPTIEMPRRRRTPRAGVRRAGADRDGVRLRAGHGPQAGARLHPESHPPARARPALPSRGRRRRGRDGALRPDDPHAPVRARTRRHRARPISCRSPCTAAAKGSKTGPGDPFARESQAGSWPAKPFSQAVNSAFSVRGACTWTSIPAATRAAHTGWISDCPCYLRSRAEQDAENSTRG